MNFLGIVMNGIFLGALYATMSYGLGLIYGVMRIVNLAHAGLLTLSAYLTFWLFTAFKLDPLLSLFFIFPLFFLLGMAIQLGLVKRIAHGPPIASLLLLFGVWLVVKNVVYLVWEGNDRSVLTSYTFKTLKVVIPLSYPRFLVFLAAILASVLLYLLLHRTSLGRAIRALSQDREAASLVGINTEWVSALAFGLGSALAALAGSLMVLIYSINPEFGGSFLLKSFCVIVLGGMESIIGIFLGGMVLGLAEAMSVLFLRASFQELISFILLVVILVVRPTGLLGVRS